MKLSDFELFSDFRKHLGDIGIYPITFQDEPAVVVFEDDSVSISLKFPNGGIEKSSYDKNGDFLGCVFIGGEEIIPEKK